MTEEPSLLKKGINLSQYTWQLMKYINDNPGRSLMASESVFDQRLSICKSCDKYKESKQECLECGCFVPAKARMILDACPLDKWGMDQSDWESRFDEITEGIDNELEE